MFGDVPTSSIEKRGGIRIEWQGEVTTTGTFTWYKSKGEYRLTGQMGKAFPYRHPDLTGALWVFCQMGEREYESYVLNTDEDMDAYFAAFGMGPQDILPGGRQRKPAGLLITPDMLRGKTQPTIDLEFSAIQTYVEYLGVSHGGDWPKSEDVSRKARDIQRDVNRMAKLQVSNPDQQIIDYTRVEYAIFREIESQAYGSQISRGFESIEEFVALANTVLNRRKSRAGKSFEHHLASLFRANGLSFEEQVRTEGNKKPDFVFPSGDAYHDMSFPVEKLVILGAKTTCKDRWRQILTEADRIEGRTKYLVTLQQGISPQQLTEMRTDGVQLVVPKAYIQSYPREFQPEIWPLKRFIEFVKETAA